MHEPRYLARMAEDLKCLDVDEFDHSFGAQAIKRYLGGTQYPRIGEASRDTQNQRPSVPGVSTRTKNKINPSNAEDTFVQSTGKANIYEKIEVLSCWYSSDSSRGALTFEYP